MPGCAGEDWQSCLLAILPIRSIERSYRPVFRASGPVTASAFFNREAEITRLLAAFDGLAAGAPSWVAVIGPRKVGKTSLILESARRAAHRVDVALVDALERAPLTLDIFRLIALRAVDALFAEEAGGSFERAAHNPDALSRLLDGAPSARSLSVDLRAEVRRLAHGPLRPEALGPVLALPEALATAVSRHLVIAIDEVQELASLAGGRTGFDPFFSSCGPPGNDTSESGT